jgi:hypothetical protein
MPAFKFVLVFIGFLLSSFRILVNSLTVYPRQNCQLSNSFSFSLVFLTWLYLPAHCRAPAIRAAGLQIRLDLHCLAPFTPSESSSCANRQRAAQHCSQLASNPLF